VSLRALVRAPILVLLVCYACTSGPSPDDDATYVTDITETRAAKDQQFREDAESPVPPEKRATILPLKYYPVDPSFSVPASLTLNDERPVFEMPTSTGTIRRMQLVGTLHFTLKGEPQTLGAFVEEGTREITTLFVPFADMTTGKETYSAGRYLDLHPTSTGFYTIDFNAAYNPYCAYSAAYECPYPPPSNRLKVAVTAGEQAPAA
jgi:uncharacterized protein (DUF1684 family)